MDTVKITIPRPPKTSADHEYITYLAVFCDDACEVRFLSKRKQVVLPTSHLHKALLTAFKSVYPTLASKHLKIA